MTVSTSTRANLSIQQRFRGRLRRSMLTIFLPITLLPVLVLGIAAYLRVYNMLESQVQTQLDGSIRSLSQDINIWVRTKENRLNQAVQRQTFKDNLTLALSDPSTPGYDLARQLIIDDLNLNNASGGITYFSDYIVLNFSGDVLLTTNPLWEGKNFGNTDHFKRLWTDGSSILVSNPEGLLEGVAIVESSFIPASDDREAVLIYGISEFSQVNLLLSEVTSNNPNATSYLTTAKGEFITLSPIGVNFQEAAPSESQVNDLLPVIHEDWSMQAPLLRTTNFDNTPTAATYLWLDSLDAGLVIEFPESVVLGELNSLAPFSLILITVTVALMVSLIWVATQRVIDPISDLTLVTSQIASGNWEQRASVNRNDEIGLLAYTFNQMAENLSQTYRTLEEQVRQRTQLLTQRSEQLEATAQVAREAAGIRDLDLLLSETTSLISEQFGFYHVGIFLLDEIRRYAVLQASNSEGGQQMLERGHKLEVGQTGIVGFVAGSGRPRIAFDVGVDRQYFDNPDLPDTRSEMALPLKIQNRVIGVLDVQSTQPAAFTDDDIDILQILADQIALAIENTRLLYQTQQTVSELENVYGQRTLQDWMEKLGGQPRAYIFDRVQVQPATSAQLQTHPDIEISEPILSSSNGKHQLAVPIMIRGQNLGSIILNRSHDESPWSTDDLELARDTALQVAIALENARLLEEAQQRAEREQVISEISSRISQSTDIDNILRTAVQELGQLPNIADVTVKIEPTQKK
jgi:GAF domain-containing protein/HAMP domain-containing protein